MGEGLNFLALGSLALGSLALGSLAFLSPFLTDGGFEGRARVRARTLKLKDKIASRNAYSSGDQG